MSTEELTTFKELFLREFDSINGTLNAMNSTTLPEMEKRVDKKIDSMSQDVKEVSAKVKEIELTLAQIDLPKLKTDIEKNKNFRIRAVTAFIVVQIVIQLLFGVGYGVFSKQSRMDTSNTSSVGRQDSGNESNKSR